MVTYFTCTIVQDFAIEIVCASTLTLAGQQKDEKSSTLERLIVAVKNHHFNLIRYQMQHEYLQVQQK